MQFHNLNYCSTPTVVLPPPNLQHHIDRNSCNFLRFLRFFLKISPTDKQQQNSQDFNTTPKHHPKSPHTASAKRAQEGKAKAVQNHVRSTQKKHCPLFRRSLSLILPSLSEGYPPPWRSHANSLTVHCSLSTVHFRAPALNPTAVHCPLRSASSEPQTALNQSPKMLFFPI
jgi:hypothetical protein